jgi:signal recognition particle receptor subunit beta
MSVPLQIPLLIFCNKTDIARAREDLSEFLGVPLWRSSGRKVALMHGSAINNEGIQVGTILRHIYVGAKADLLRIDHYRIYGL